MTARTPDNRDLHGNARDRSAVALLITDMLNALDFPGNEELVRDAVRLVLPDADDYLVLKPKHSVFYATPLDTWPGCDSSGLAIGPTPSITSVL